MEMDFCKENIRDAWQKVNEFTEGKASHQTINGRCPYFSGERVCLLLHLINAQMRVAVPASVVEVG